MGFKIKDILKVVKIGTSVGKVVAPGGVGGVLDAVNRSIDNEDDPSNAEGLRAVAEVNDEQTQAILALHERLKNAENKIDALQRKAF